MQKCEDSNLPLNLDITPAVTHYDYWKNKTATVNVSNLTTNTVTSYWRTKYWQCTSTDRWGGQTEKRSSKQTRKNIFSTGDSDIGNCDKVKPRIDLLDDTPFKQRHRRIPPMMIDEIRNHLEQLLSVGIIRKSRSPWCSKVVLVRKRWPIKNVRWLQNVKC